GRRAVLGLAASASRIRERVGLRPPLVSGPPGTGADDHLGLPPPPSQRKARRGDRQGAQHRLRRARSHLLHRDRVRRLEGRMSEVAAYVQFAERLVADGVLTDPWYEGLPRFADEPVWLDAAEYAELARAAEDVASVYDEVARICA